VKTCCGRGDWPQSAPHDTVKSVDVNLGDTSCWRVSPASAPQIFVLEAFARVAGDAYVIVGGRGFGRLCVLSLD